jgi:hypothetical protein
MNSQNLDHLENLITFYNKQNSPKKDGECILKFDLYLQILAQILATAERNPIFFEEILQSQKTDTLLQEIFGEWAEKEKISVDNPVFKIIPNKNSSSEHEGYLIRLSRCISNYEKIFLMEVDKFNKERTSLLIKHFKKEDFSMSDPRLISFHGICGKEVIYKRLNMEKPYSENTHKTLEKILEEISELEEIEEIKIVRIAPSY